MGSNRKQIAWIHGWGMSSRVWGDLSSLLPQAEHTFMSYEGCETTPDIQQVLRNLLEEKKGPWTLISWSMGGMLALEEIFRGEAQIEEIVLINSTLKFVDGDRMKGWPNRIIERMKKQLVNDTVQTLQHFALGMLGEHEKNNGEASLLICGINGEIETDFTPAGLEAGLSYLQETDLTKPWANWRANHKHPIKPRLLWVHGSEDTICPPGCIPELENDERVMLDNTGHVPMLTKPVLLAEQLRSFIYGYE